MCSCVYFSVCQVLACVLASLTLCVKCWPVLLFLLHGWSVFLCRLHCVLRADMCFCVYFSVCQVMACVLVSLTLCVKSWPVFLRLLHFVLSVGLYYCFSYTVGLCSYVAYTVC